MWIAIRRMWRYWGMKLRVVHEEHADPKIQLEQAIEEARTEHRRLTDTAAMVIAHQKQASDRLDAKVSECEQTRASARRALLLVDRETRNCKPDLAARFTAAAEGLAERVLEIERETSELEQGLLQATQAADRARSAVAQNAQTLQDRLRQKEGLLSVLDQAKMQESLNRASEQLAATLDDTVPTYAAIEQKIFSRHALALAKRELMEPQAVSSYDAALVEVETAQRRAQAQLLLAQYRDQLGLQPELLPGSFGGPRALER